MAAEIRVPQMGESIFEATIGKWLKQEGDAVASGEPVLELETEKVNVEVTASQGGTLEKILRREGETVKVGEVLGTITEGAVAGQPRAETEEQVSGAAQRQPVEAEREAERGKAAAPSAEARPAEARQEVLATPVARKLAGRYGIDISKVKGTGAGGRTTQEDVEEYVASMVRQAQPRAKEAPPEQAPARPPQPEARPAPATEPPPEALPRAAPRPGRYEERVRLSRRRQTIARRLVEATQTAAMTTTYNEIDMSAVVDLRRRRRESFKQRHNVDLGFMSFFVKAVVGALKAFPQVNAELDGDELVLKYYYDIGIAVGSDEGLVVPVLRDADKKTFAEIEAEIADMVQRTRERKLTLEELTGGTFTITNGGVFGSLMSAPLLNPPQVGILGMHRIMERPVAVSGQVVIRPMMYVALTYDHRVVDGADAVRFLVRVKELAEDPAALLLDA